LSFQKSEITCLVSSFLCVDTSVFLVEVMGRSLVKKEGIQLTNEESAGYDEIVTMMPMIDTYCQKYVEDLANRLRINDPMFGREPKIVGSGLMTPEQFRRARDGLLKLMQTEFDQASPVEDTSNWEDEANELDGSSSEEDNDSYNHAKSELERFERFKKVRYLPTLKFDRCLWAVNENGVDVEIGVGPIEKRGENLPSGKTLQIILIRRDG
jgi:hypothetical protein